MDIWEQWLRNNQLIVVSVFAGGYLVLAVALLVNWLRVRRLLKKYNTLFRGAEGRNLEVILSQHMANVSAALGRVKELESLCRKLEEMSVRSIQYKGLVRYDAFDNVGGEQSFSLALLDRNRDGVVITSLFGRDETRVYAKEIRGGKSAHALSEEEKEALRRAMTTKESAQ